MKHKGKKLQRKIGKDDYDVLFDVVNEYVDMYEPENMLTERSIPFYNKVKALKEKYF